jgi:micrococcal nuclease
VTRTRARSAAGLAVAIPIVILIAVTAQLLRPDSAPGTPSPSTPASELRAADVPLLAGSGDDAGERYIEDPERLPLFEVDRVIDGDTFDVRDGDATLRIRVFGLAAPERNERCGSEATAELRRLVADRVRLLPDARLQDQYGRELRYVFTPDGRSIDAASVADGAAHAWHEDGAYRDTLTRLEEQARQAGAGCLWG